MCPRWALVPAHTPGCQVKPVGGPARCGPQAWLCRVSQGYSAPAAPHSSPFPRRGHGEGPLGQASSVSCQQTHSHAPPPAWGPGARPGAQRSILRPHNGGCVSGQQHRPDQGGRGPRASLCTSGEGGHPAEVCGCWVAGRAGESSQARLGPLKAQQPPGLKDGWGGARMMSPQVGGLSPPWGAGPPPGPAVSQRPGPSTHACAALPDTRTPVPAPAWPRASPCGTPSTSLESPTRHAALARATLSSLMRVGRRAQTAGIPHEPARGRCLFRQAPTHPPSWLALQPHASHNLLDHRHLVGWRAGGGRAPRVTHPGLFSHTMCPCPPSTRAMAVGRWCQAWEGSSWSSQHAPAVPQGPAARRAGL